ncbi:hypothetical protein I5H38_gp72 [Mycobacterium phage Firehouse51]|uniref:DNA-binding phage zinc finger domain-containing protein n=3 Tax=Gracegardnervirinae TaxID=2946632 RepID=A0A6G9LFG9_9CAUD|nr:hypothetical protein N850_gp083 [Mycobacterium phage Jabbawokkie]YP_009957166.1 hypothetical protein I5H38_gp72 [Mycobacterium phage Firehouse51]YP_009963158.1 hypothetical protein I5H96_gp68 [Mycobacterium phage Veteran]YP_009964001.1 hypothetical protein I5I04_gp084 [Mycobacterium phage Zapner]AGT12184.1 hypothetical protein JABBAWOKKIE_85 [Mycobacterium phage Jabbawokkie]AHZ95538.1 hypothetical protein PBI_ZAPNER_84 [Mycobacterium phage Zapner]QIQ63416.1 hypothetical protein SEA_VETERAN
MKDWRGTTVHQEALRVSCRDCRAAVEEPCVVRDEKGRVVKVLEAFPAHAHRIADSRSAASGSGDTTEALKVAPRGAQPQESTPGDDA